MKRYDKYKTSGFEWLGHIPEHWAVKKLKYVASLKSGDGITADSIRSEGEYPVFGGNGVRGHTTSYSHEGDFVVIGRQGALCGNINYTKGKFWASDHAVVATPIERYDLIWFGELLRIMNLNQHSQSAAQPGLAVEKIKNLFVPVPSINEQTAIADFLDKKTSQIDTLIANKQKLIELLKEERTAIINQAATKGINPKAKLKPSGIEWLGDIPKHWEVKKLKYIAIIISGGAFDSSSFSKFGSVKVLKIANIQHDYIDWADTEYLPDNFANDYERFRLFSGDIVFALTRPIISTGIKSARIVFNENEIVLLNQRNAILRATKYLDDSFIYFVTHSSYFYHMFETSIDDTGQQPNISPISIMNFEIILPPYEEQIEISRHIKAETQRVDATISKIEKEIDLLPEYRTALISEVVTGKIKVI